MIDDEFYIGYFPNAPKETVSVVRKIIVIIGILTVSIALLLAWNQKQFATSNFEYGTNTTIEGFLFTSPIPHISVPFGELANGKKLYQNILLVGAGKAGAEKVISRIESKAGRPLRGTKVKLSGYLIFGDGKAIMQITEEDNTNDLDVSEEFSVANLSESIWENLSITGEVVDPKCYFGVMKPGEGKAHRACAIRCIAGGIPPVFHPTGSSDYFLLVDENSEALHDDLLPIVGDKVRLTGVTTDWGDWKILKVNLKTIKTMAREKKTNEYLLSFNRGITQCDVGRSK